MRRTTPGRTQEALKALNSYGISGHDLEDDRLHVTGWDVRLLHWRLGILLAGVDDLTMRRAGAVRLRSWLVPPDHRSCSGCWKKSCPAAATPGAATVVSTPAARAVRAESSTSAPDLVNCHPPTA